MFPKQFVHVNSAEELAMLVDYLESVIFKLGAKRISFNVQGYKNRRGNASVVFQVTAIDIDETLDIPEFIRKTS